MSFLSFKELAQSMIKEKEKVNINNICKYGLSVLDDFLGGIKDGQLVIIGAKTGVGKTDICFQVAKTNALLGKKVGFYSLEGNIHELAYRFFITHINKKREKQGKQFISPSHYYLNIGEFEQYEKEILEDEELKPYLENIHIFDKKKIPTKKDFIESIKESFYKFDMFVVDHLHYFDLEGNKNKADGLSDLIRTIKELTEIIGKPVILASHLRRTAKNEELTVEHLFGSSDLEKNGDIVIFIEKDEKETDFCDKLPDYCVRTRITLFKNRMGFVVPAYFNAVYDIRKKEYIEKYSAVAKESEEKLRFLRIGKNVSF